MNKTLLLLFAALSLQACAFGYFAQGSLSDVAGSLRGKAYPGPSGGGRFVLAGSNGLSCDGTAHPPRQSPQPGSCEGESGDGVLRCTDGREVSFEWQARTCRSFEGRGMDARGNRFEFQFGRR
ncbi:hypothetical protein GBK02_08750 [Dechloromonas sp. TW-R-39-2]|uniref:hypothetical protein n=1 Tax=Dechloromonas sp. TW-R-39-2 TaxID=2654218 RepID=UPI00193CE3D5|nr:hypothetical protein [Dechloromonas sp. TW-R-39-2]QRM19481.1 hypothetical protein GBK02_08750 [Dechloromonas sp. TW-R-39-2]